MAIRFSPTKVVDSTEAVALTTHRSSDGTDHANVVLGDTHRTGSGSDHADVASATAELAKEEIVLVSAVAIDTLNDEQSTAIGGSSGNQFKPTYIEFHLEAVGGAGATGDAQITVGTSAGGTQILTATTVTNMKDLNDTFGVSVTGLLDPIGADSTLYVKCTTADTTAGAGHLMDAHITGEIFPTGT